MEVIMRGIFPSWFNRQIDIIEFLSLSLQPIFIKDLLIEMNISERLLREDINSINTNIASDIFYIAIQHNQVELIFHENMNIKNSYHRFFDISVNHLVLEFIFFNETKSVEEIASYFFVSTTTMYRKIKHINKVIQSEYDIYISTNPCKIMGSEINIRHFFSQYLSEKYMNRSWPFDSIPQKDLTIFVTEVFSIFKVPMDYAIIQNIKYLIGVAIIRLNNDHTINPQNVDPVKVEGLTNYLLANQELSKTCSQLFNKHLTQDLITDIFSSYTQKDLFFTYKELIKASMVNENARNSYLYFSYLIEELSDNFNIPILNRNQLIRVLHITSYLEKMEIYSNHMFFKKKSPMVNILMDRMPKFYEEAYESLIEVLKKLKLNVSDAFIEHLFYTLVVHWEGLHHFFLINKKPVKTLLLSNIDFFHAQLTKSMIEAHLSNYLEIKIVNEDIIHLEDLTNFDSQLIIANFPLGEVEDKVVLVVNDTPTHRDIINISNIVDSCFLTR